MECKNKMAKKYLGPSTQLLCFTEKIVVCSKSKFDHTSFQTKNVLPRPVCRPRLRPGRVPVQPGLHEAPDVCVLVAEEYHAHPGYGGGGGEGEVVGLEHEVDVGAELDAPPRRQGQEAVVILKEIKKGRLYHFFNLKFFSAKILI